MPKKEKLPKQKKPPKQAKHVKQQKKRKGRSVQDFIGVKTFTKYGLMTQKGELLFYLVSPTNISVLSYVNIEIKIRHLMMVLSSIPDIEITCTDSSECFDDNKAYVNASDDTSYLPNAMLSNMRSIAAESDNRQSRMLFKLSVEIAMLQNLFAAFHDVDPESLERLRGECVQEVKRLNGSFSLKDAVEWQKE